MLQNNTLYLLLLQDDRIKMKFKFSPLSYISQGQQRADAYDIQWFHQHKFVQLLDNLRLAKRKLVVKVPLHEALQEEPLMFRLRERDKLAPYFLIE